MIRYGIGVAVLSHVELGMYKLFLNSLSVQTPVHAMKQISLVVGAIFGL